MATITGSSTSDWSGVPLGPIEVQQDFDEFDNRFVETIIDINGGNFIVNPPNTSTFLSITITEFGFSPGAIVTFTGSGLDLTTPDPVVIKTIDYNNPSTGEVVSVTGTIDFVGNDTINSLTIVFPGFQKTIIGNIVHSPSGIYSGSITELQETLDSTEMTLKGSLVLSGNFDISGTVTQISVLSGTDTILMSGLSLPYGALDSVTTANDLFSVVGNLMSGNDTITYTNNSGVGMTFYGGAGADTITISGPNADTLNGGAGNDLLNGGAGNDAMDGGAGNDTYVVDSLGDSVTETLAGAAGGTDLVQSAVNFTLGAGATNVENLTLTGTDNSNGTGNILNNILTGNSGNNQLSGLAGTDKLIGGVGNDTLDGGAGVDNMAGGLGDDTYVVDVATDVVTEALNAGTDKVFSSINYILGANLENLELTGGANLTGTGNALANVLTGNSGNNLLSGLAGTDTLDGGAGTDTLIGGLGLDSVMGGLGDDQITMLVTAGNVDTIDAGDGTDTLLLSGVVPGNHVVVVDLSSSTDQVTHIGTVDPESLVQINFENLNASGIGSSVNVTGSAGDNIIIGSNGNDILNGGAGNDTINGGAGADTLQGEAGDDLILLASTAEFATGELIDGGADTNTLRLTSTVAGTLTLTANVINIEQVELATAAGLTTGLAALNVNAAAVNNGLTLVGNNGANVLTGTSFADTLIGNGGNDTLNGGSDNDQLEGGTGNDVLNGGAGADTLLGGDGNDVFLIAISGESELGESVVGGLGTDALRVTATAGTVVLSGSIDVESVQMATAAGVSTGTGAVGVDASGVTNGLTILGNNGTNQIIGTGFADTLTGGAGADNLQGEAGDDIILLASMAEFAVGEVIDGGTQDITGDTVRFISTVAGTLTLSANVIDVERVEIANAAGLTTGLAAINVNAAAVANGLTMIGNNGANVLTGTGQADTLIGNGGNDTLNGGFGNDMLDGGAGNDVLTGGVGADTLLGGEGNDVFLFAVGDSGPGESVVGGAGTDALRFTATSGSLDLSGSVDVESVVIATAAGAITGTTAVDLNAATVTNALSIIGNNGANQITGTAFADTLTGNLGNDTLKGGDGNDTLNGGTGADNLQGEAGDDIILLASMAEFAVGEVIDGGTQDITGDTVRFTSTVAGTLTLSANVIDVERVEIANAAGLTTGLAAINVNAAAVANGLTMIGNNGANVLTGTGQADTLIGNGGNDTLTGGAGDDTLNGGDGNDVVLIAAGAHHGTGEVIDGGAGSNVIRFTSTAAGTLTLSAGVTGIAEVEASDAAGGNAGTAALSINATAVTSGLTLTGNAGVNTLTGTALADVLVGNAGNDVLNGGAGNDQLDGGLGQDTVNGEAGDDRITMLVTTGNVDDSNGGDGTDTLVLSGVVPGNHVVEVDLGASDQVVSIGSVLENHCLQSNFENLDASGLGGSVQVTGSDVDNIIIGSKGNDTLTGEAGNDTLIGGAGADNLNGGLSDDLILLASAAEFAAGEVINGGADFDILRYTGNVAATLTLTAKVTNLEAVQIANAGGSSTGTAAINVNAAAVANSLTISGNDGNNVLSGTGQADFIIGNGGNDQLIGGAGNDTLIGNAGADRLVGGLGNDAYWVYRGDGKDIISENDSTPGNSDALLYGATINPLDLVLSRQVNDLRIAIHGSTDQVTIKNWYSAPTTAQVETIQAANGQTLLNTQVNQLIQAMAAFTGNTNISWDDAIAGAGTAQQQAQFQGILAANWQ